MTGLILFGWISFRGLGISEMPDVDFPVVTVQVTYEGASPEVMESDVVDIVEDSVMSVQGIRSISSTSRQSDSLITIEFDLDRNIDAALQEVQTKIAQAQKRLPKQIDPPIVTKTNPEDQPIMWVSLSTEGPLREMMEYARDNLKDRLQTVNGVGEVIFGGYLEPELRVWVDPKKLDQYELTIQDVIDAIGKEHVEIPAGRIETPLKEINIRTMGEALTPEAFGEIIISRRGPAAIYKPFRIKDVATVEKGLDDVRRMSRTNGKPSIGLGIKKQRGSNAVKVADGVYKQIDALGKIIPKQFHLQVNFDSTRFIRNSVHEMEKDLILAALLTAFVCLLFLGSWGATFNVLLAIPTSIIGSFIFIYFYGFTLNTFTLLGLMLAIGIVVDDAIMVLENIVRHREMGKSSLKAAEEGGTEVTSAAIAATVAIIAIFIPVVFMKGVIGKFFLQFGVTMVVAVSLSLLEAITLTPMRASRMLKEVHAGRFEQAVNVVFGKMSALYSAILKRCLNHRWIVIFLASLLFIGSFAFLPSLRKEFVPAQDQSMFLVRFQTPLGSSIDYTSEKMKEAEKLISSYPEVLRYYLAVGGFMGGEVNSAMMFITLKQPQERPVDPEKGKRLSQLDIMNKFRKDFSKIPDVMGFVQDLSTRGFTAQRGFPIEFSVRGADWAKLTEYSNKILETMRSNKMFQDVDTDYQTGQPEIQVKPIREQAFIHKVLIEDLGKVVNGMIGGVKVGKFTEGAHRNDIRVRAREDDRQIAQDITKLKVRNQTGELVPMTQVAQTISLDTLKSITRKDRERSIGIFANLGPGESQAKVIQETEKIAKSILPEGYRIVWSGSAQTFQESFESLLFVLYLGVIVAYMVLASQYNSFVHPIVVLLALPFSLSGAWVALKLFNSSLNIYSFIGLILLMGIAKKNSILLVDFTNQERRKGNNVREALEIACPQRLRPILMTSIATIAAAIPPAMGLGAGSETRVPMAIVILGGVIVSTFLTLFVVPCAYSLMSRLEKKPIVLS